MIRCLVLKVDGARVQQFIRRAVLFKASRVCEEQEKGSSHQTHNHTLLLIGKKVPLDDQKTRSLISHQQPFRV